MWQAKGESMPFCPLDEDMRAFVLPSAAALDRARVVVCSCTGAGDVAVPRSTRAHVSLPVAALPLCVSKLMACDQVPGNQMLCGGWPCL